MTKECGTCHYWDVIYQGQIPYAVKNLPHGQCLKALMYDSYEKDCPGELDPMITLDGSMYMSILMTRPDHSCKEYKERKKNGRDCKKMCKKSQTSI